MDESTVEVVGLIIATAAGSERAFKRLVAVTSPLLFGVLMRMLKDRATAEDALQAVFLKVWTKAHTFRAHEVDPQAWLVTIARYHAIDILRSQTRKVRIDHEYEEVHPDDRWNGERQIIASQDVATVFRCMESLTANRATAIRMAYLDGASYQDLANHFSIPLNTVRTWLRRGLQQLRECFENVR